MDKAMLEQYQDICAEIEELIRRASTPVTDTVSGSSLDYPYTQHSISVRGVAATKEDCKRLAELRKQKETVEKFMASLPTSKQRRIFSLRLQGNDWNTVAAKMGYRYSVDAVKKIFQRTLK